jgi:hypothetical protein
MERVAVKKFLEAQGVTAGDDVAVIDRRPPVYWGRMLKVTIVGEIPDVGEYLRSAPTDREAALRALRNENVRAVVGKGAELHALEKDGWRLVPGTRDYFVSIISGLSFDKRPAP